MFGTTELKNGLGWLNGRRYDLGDKNMNGRVHQEDETKLKATVALKAASEIEVVQPTAADLNATVTQAEKDRTITGTATVTPSGDMARKALYDRTSELIHKYWSGYESTHGVTVRWTYTVPDGRKAIHTFLSGIMFIDIATADKVCEQTWEILKAGGAFTPVVQQLFIGTDGYFSRLINNASFTLFAEDGIRGVTVNGDTTGHVFSSSSVLTEFDE